MLIGKIKTFLPVCHRALSTNIKSGCEPHTATRSAGSSHYSRAFGRAPSRRAPAPRTTLADAAPPRQDAYRRLPTVRRDARAAAVRPPKPDHSFGSRFPWSVLPFQPWPAAHPRAPDRSDARATEHAAASPNHARWHGSGPATPSAWAPVLGSPAWTRRAPRNDHSEPLSSRSTAAPGRLPTHTAATERQAQ